MTRSSQSLGPIKSQVRTFYTIGEVAVEVGVKQYVLRFWESKFFQINPVKRRGRRLYSTQDIETIKKIKHMLYDLGYTIKGVQLELGKKQTASDIETSAPKGRERVLVDLFGSLVEIRDMITEKLGDGM